MQHLLGAHSIAWNSTLLENLCFASSLINITPLLTETAHLIVSCHVILVLDDG